MKSLDLAGKFPALTVAATDVLKHLGPPFTQTPNGHIQSDIAASCSLSGLMILQEVVSDLANHQPGAVILSDVHSRREEVHRFMENFANSNGLDPVSGWNHEIPKEHEPMLECAEMTRRLATHFYQAVAQLDRPYYKFVGALVGMRLVLAGQSRRMLDPMIGKSLALYYVVAGSKTVPFPEALWTDRQVPNIEDVARQLTGAKAGLDPIGKIGFKPKSDVSEDELDELLDKIEQLLGTRRAPVPSQFQRAFEGRPFDSCDFCRRPLLETGTLYMIIKYHAQKELRQELAICHSCLGELGETYSEKSLKVTKAFYAEGFLEAHRARIRTSPNARVEELTSRCWRCAKERANVSEYFDYAFCDGGEILVYTYPFMQCGNCTLDLVRSLSDQTLEARRRFFADHFGLPPDIYAFEPAEFIMAELP